MSYLTKDMQFAAAIQTTPGTEEAINAATDAIDVEEPNPDHQLASEETNEATGSHDSRPSIFAGGYGQDAIQPIVKASGTPGQAPRQGRILRAGSFQEVIQAAVSDTAQAGSPNSITLALTESAVVDIFKGMPCYIIAGTGVGQKPRVIKSYSAGRVATVFPNWTTPPDATSVYSIPANVLYSNISKGADTITAHLWEHNSLAGVNSLLHRIRDAAADFTITLPTRNAARMQTTLRGVLVDKPEPVALPAVPQPDPTRPPPILNAESFFGQNESFHSQIQLAMGNVVEQPDRPSERFGYGNARVTDRRIRTSIDPLLAEPATRDNWEDFITGPSLRDIWLNFGEDAGNRISFFFPNVQVIQNARANVRGFSTDAVQVEHADPDDGVFICYH